MDYQPAVPQGALAACVEVFFHLDAYNPEHGKERLVPDGTISLVIELDGQERAVYDHDNKIDQTCLGGWVSGVHRSYLSFDTPPNTRLMAVRFLPGQAAQVLGLPIARLNDQVLPAEDVLGVGFVELRQRLLELKESSERLACLGQYLEELHDPNAAAPASVNGVVSAICDDPTIARLDALVAESGASRKHLAELFKRFVGPTPKLFQRIRRFAQVFAVLQESPERIDWAGVSADCGYFDQAHFIRDFQSFSGYRPAPFAEKMGDRQNFFPEE